MTRQEYATILFGDLGFLPSQRRAWLMDRYGVRFLDELDDGQLAALVGELKEWKEERKTYQLEEEDGGEEGL